jgi:formylglycine-generating enzyme
MEADAYLWRWDGDGDFTLGFPMHYITRLVALMIAVSMPMAVTAEDDKGAQIVHTASVMDAGKLLPEARAAYTRKGNGHFELSMNIGKPTRDLGVGSAAVPGKFLICSLSDLAQSQGKSGAVMWTNPDNQKDMVAFVSRKDELNGIASEVGMKPEQLHYIPVAESARNMANAGYPCKQFTDPPRRSVSSALPKEPRSPGSVFKDCDVCPQMVSIPGGSFDMGLRPDDGRFDRSGQPVHKVTIHSFAMGKTEVTRAEFAAFASDTHYVTEDKCAVFLAGTYGGERSAHNWQNVGFVQEDSHPVTCVSWQDAQAYVAWLSRKTSKNYRLPSEAEWEYAARAGTTTPRYWDGTGQEACGFANIPDASLLGAAPAKPDARPSSADCSDGFAYTAPVGSFKPNAFGLFDMLGNVWEWVEDRYHEDYVGAPTDGSAWTTSKFDFRMFRGGSWIDAAINTNVATRARKIGGPRANIVGVRVAVAE